MPEVLMAVLPMILWFVERLLPFPAVVEEAAKALVVVRADSRRQAFFWGLIFGLSEAFLFLVNANLLADLSGFWRRLALTVPMHGVTAGLIMLWGKRYWWLGLPVAMLTHAWFNLRIAS
ncbi:MAG: hypothetical protein UY37_C0004G0138 [Candidatus Beckwithbacteria bacterium GW2011_GWC2_49_11]|nr:MAG: hypothetical protein UY37_C0004G0138 [Candidatus Beckwithbacteria bacterium GW2011_GWC2_49_11]OGD49763.1 MAG: hypothetical protein A3D86_04910 [Candidatus Beckwithbacteria bacterium RIFCSPHIGHO2_02_FULL_49_13]